MQELGRTIKYWSVAISHVQWARQFKLCWSRQHHAAVPRERMIEVHRVHVKDFRSRRSSSLELLLAAKWVRDASTVHRRPAAKARVKRIMTR